MIIKSTDLNTTAFCQVIINKYNINNLFYFYIEKKKLSTQSDNSGFKLKVCCLLVITYIKKITSDK